jgi:MFS family permease
VSDALVALRLPGVRRYIGGRAVASLGQQALSTAVGWDIYDRTHSTVALGLVGLVQVVPVIVLALPAGGLIDRTNRRDVTIAAFAMHAVAALFLACAARTAAPILMIYLALLVNGVARSVSGPAASALFAQTVPPEHFVNANAWRSTSFELASTVGPAIAGPLIAMTAGASWVYVLAAVGVLAFAVVAWTIPRPPMPPISAPRPGGWSRGLRFVFGTDLLLAAITLDLFAVLFGGATALLPVFAEDILKVGPSGLGLLRAAPAIGAMTMAVITTRIRPWRHSGKVLLIAVFGFGAATIVFGRSQAFVLSFIALLLTGVFDNVSVVIRLTLEQLIVPEELRGRVGAIHNVFIGLSNEMGELESGLAAAAIGTVPAVVVGGLMTLGVVGFAAWRWPVLRRLGPMRDLRPAREPGSAGRGQS